MKRLKGCISLLAVLFGMTFLIGNGNAQAKVVTDDAGDQVDIPDSYFLKNSDQLQANLDKQFEQIKPISTYWALHPDVQLSSLSPELAKKFPDFSTFNELVNKYHQLAPQYSIDDIRTTLLALAKDFSMLNKMGTHGFLDTEKVQIINPLFSRIVQPSKMTVYNQTGSSKVDYALKYAFKQWSKDPRFKFRMVDSPKNARIIVTDLSHSKATSKNFEPNYEAAFIPTIIYYSTLVQGQIVLSQDVLNMDQNDPNFLHIIVHEIGHSMGRVDLI